MSFFRELLFSDLAKRVGLVQKEIHHHLVENELIFTMI
jgi:hypothetical protein